MQITEHQSNTHPREISGDFKGLHDSQHKEDRDLIKAVSGYGRELFFSNIIDYIAKHCPEVITEALRAFLPESGFENVKRENRHMDLVFFSKDTNGKLTPVLVVENKRGSIATQKQLDDYIKNITGNKEKKSGKNSECSFLLISPHFFDKDVADKADWLFMGYSELGRRLNSALICYAEKNPDYPDSLEFKLLSAAIEYMAYLEEESTRIYEQVTPDTICKDLHPEGDTADNIKLRYHAVAHMLISKLENEGIFRKMEEQRLLTSEHQYFEASFDSGTSAPLVRMEVKQLIRTKENEAANFGVYFQGDYLSIGFGMHGTFDTLDKQQKKEYRNQKWEENNFDMILEQITGDSESFKDYKGTGYMASDYILTMFRRDVRDKSVREIVEAMCCYAQGALEYHKKINL